MKQADDHGRKEGESMSDTAIQRLISYLRSEGWTEAQILKLLDYITKR